MADLPRYPHAHEGTDLQPEPESAAGTSRWVYVIMAIGIALFLLLVVLHLTGISGPVHH